MFWPLSWYCALWKRLHTRGGFPHFGWTFQSTVLSVTHQWVGRPDAKRFLIRVINNICYVRYKVEKLHRIHIVFYDRPLLDATQYYQNLKLCQGPFLFIDGKKSVLHPGNYDLMIYSLNFSRLARTWPVWDWAIHLNVNAQVRRKKPGLNSLYPH